MKEQNRKGRSPIGKAKKQAAARTSGTPRKRALRVGCAERLNISLVRELHGRLQQALQERRPIIIDGTDVEQVDAAALQLLCALVRDAETIGISLKLKDPSEALRMAASLSGLTEYLGLAAA